MRRFVLFCSAVALTFLLSTAALAQKDGDNDTKAKTSTTSSAAAKPTSSAPAKAKPAPAPAPKPKASIGGPTVPRVEWFLGYSYVRVHVSGEPSVNFNGGSTSIAYNFNKYFGLVADLGGYHAGSLPDSTEKANVFSYVFGPRFSFRSDSRLTPYVQGLLGGSRLSVYDSTSSDHRAGFAGVAGGGLDYAASDRIGIRLVQAEYFLTRFRNIAPSIVQHNLRISSGIVFRLGSINPPPPPPPPNRPPVAACSAQPSSVYAGSGDVVTVRAQASDPDSDPLTYSWSASGGRVDGTGSDVRWNSAGLAPGTYTVTARVDDGKGGTASCSADVRVEVKPNRPPTLSCSADRSTVLVGERVKILGAGNDPDGDPLTYTWRTSGGQVVGSGSSVELDTSGLAPGRYTVTGRADDGRGSAADCSVGVEVQAPPPPPQASKINECSFTRAGIARTDNVCKRVLDDVALRLKNEPRGTVVLVGYADPKETKPDALAQKRGDNVKEYIVSKGVDGSRITVRTAGGQKGADQENRRVDIIWVPEGATY